jgi:serine O-acetyltransferase
MTSTAQPERSAPRRADGALLALMRSDLVHAAALWGVPARRAVPRGAGKLLLYPRVRAAAYFRISQRLWRRRWTRPLALLVQAHVLRIAGAEIHPAAEIGRGFCLVHSNGVVIGARTRIGKDLRCYQQVTLGDNGWVAGQPVIGDEVVLGAGCKVLGQVSVGDRAVIGANAVVVKDVPADAVVVGARAEVRPRER